MVQSLAIQQANRRMPQKSNRPDAVVIGGGPAGAVTACILAQSGQRVVLFDKAKMPRPKVCGCCLNHAALSALHSAGLSQTVESWLGIPLHRLAIHHRGQTIDAELTPGLAVERARMDTSLLQSCRQAGVSVHTGQAVHVALDEERYFVQAGEQVLTPEVIIVADGLGGSSLRGVAGFDVEVQRESKIGLGAVLETTQQREVGVIEMAVGSGGYVGTVVLPGGRLDVAAAIKREAIKAASTPEAAIASIQREAGVTPTMHTNARWRATPALTRRRRVVARGNVFVVGDAAGYVEPFTGEGMAWAMQGGLRLARLLSQANAGRDRLAERWNQIYNPQRRQQQRGCEAIAFALRHDSRARLTLSLLQRQAWLARFAVKRFQPRARA